MAKTKPNIGTIDCNGPEGNIFYIVGLAKKALQRSGHRNLGEELCDRVFKSGSYEEAKAIIAEYVEVEYVNS